MKRILIDVNPVVPYFVSGKINGIGRTCRELVSALDRQADSIPFEIMLFSQNMKGIGGKNIKSHFNSRHLFLPNRTKFNKLVKALHLREILTGYDLMHITHNHELVAHPERCIVTIHDAMFFAYPEEMFNPEKCRRLYTDIARSCRAIITCSESSKRDIVKYMGVPEDKVSVTPWGVRHDLFYPRRKTANQYCGDSPYFISSSCDTGRKNTISVIRAFAEYCKSDSADHHLVLVWRNPPLEITEEIEKLGISAKVHFASNISDELLAQLYSSATACFFPSLYEGFGLPILESMACGSPVVTCNNSSLPEVGGDAAIYVEPYDVAGMAEWMRKLEKDTRLVESLRTKSVEQASQFTWERCARQTIEVYKKCLGL